MKLSVTFEVTSNNSELLRALTNGLLLTLTIVLNTKKMGMSHGSMNVFVIIRMVPLRLPEYSHLRNFSKLVEIERGSFF